MPFEGLVPTLYHHPSGLYAFCCKLHIAMYHMYNTAQGKGLPER